MCEARRHCKDIRCNPEVTQVLCTPLRSCKSTPQAREPLCARIHEQLPLQRKLLEARKLHIVGTRPCCDAPCNAHMTPSHEAAKQREISAVMQTPPRNAVTV